MEVSRVLADDNSYNFIMALMQRQFTSAISAGMVGYAYSQAWSALQASDRERRLLAPLVTAAVHVLLALSTCRRLAAVLETTTRRKLRRGRLCSSAAEQDRRGRERQYALGVHPDLLPLEHGVAAY